MSASCYISSTEIYQRLDAFMEAPVIQYNALIRYQFRISLEQSTPSTDTPTGGRCKNILTTSYKSRLTASNSIAEAHNVKRD